MSDFASKVSPCSIVVVAITVVDMLPGGGERHLGRYLSADIDLGSCCLGIIGYAECQNVAAWLYYFKSLPIFHCRLAPPAVVSASQRSSPYHE